MLGAHQHTLGQGHKLGLELEQGHKLGLEQGQEHKLELEQGQVRACTQLQLVQVLACRWEQGHIEGQQKPRSKQRREQQRSEKVKKQIDNKAKIQN